METLFSFIQPNPGLIFLLDKFHAIRFFSIIMVYCDYLNYAMFRDPHYTGTTGMRINWMMRLSENIWTRFNIEEEKFQYL